MRIITVAHANMASYVTIVITPCQEGAARCQEGNLLHIAIDIFAIQARVRQNTTYIGPAFGGGPF